jgi:hypothetical protein
MASGVRAKIQEIEPVLSRFERFRLKLLDQAETPEEDKDRGYKALLERHLSQLPGGNLSSTDGVSDEERDIADEKFLRVVRRRAFAKVLNRDGRVLAVPSCQAEPDAGTIDCAVQPQNGERETLVIALAYTVVPVVVAIRSAHIRRLALAGIGVTASASLVVVSSFVYIIAANPVC